MRNSLHTCTRVSCSRNTWILLNLRFFILPLRIIRKTDVFYISTRLTRAQFHKKSISRFIALKIHSYSISNPHIYKWNCTWNFYLMSLRDRMVSHCVNNKTNHILKLVILTIKPILLVRTFYSWLLSLNYFRSSTCYSRVD